LFPTICFATNAAIFLDYLKQKQVQFLPLARTKRNTQKSKPTTLSGRDKTHTDPLVLRE
jgi:hypothetical protein